MALACARRVRCVNWRQSRQCFGRRRLSTSARPPESLIRTPRIVHEDEHLLIVSKPVKMHTAPPEGVRKELSQETNLVEWVTSKYPEVAAVKGRKPAEGGLLHRLDFSTSGLIMFGKTQQAFDNLLEQFNTDEVLKGYIAVSNILVGPGKPNDLTKEVWHSVLTGAPAFKLPIRVTVDSKFQTAGVGGTKVKVIMPNEKVHKKRKTTTETYHSDITLLFRKSDTIITQVKILRGYRHQIRAHLSYLGLPIVGDPLYNVNTTDESQPMMLHALALSFRHPITGEKMIVSDDLPDYIKPLVGEV